MHDLAQSLQHIDMFSLSGMPDCRRVASTRGGEYADACPLCGGKDRFRVQPTGGRDGRGVFMCRNCHEQWGDAVEFLQWRHGVTFKEALEMLRIDMPMQEVSQPVTLIDAPEQAAAPSEVWQQRAAHFALECIERLASGNYPKPLAWLARRGVTQAMIDTAEIGFNNENRFESPELWGLGTSDDCKAIYLPRGIVIPWTAGNDIWRLNIRTTGTPKYQAVRGGSNGLYQADTIKAGLPCVLVEGEFDALLLRTLTGIAAVATGSTGGSRRIKWQSRLAMASTVLVAFDNDDDPNKGEKAASYWCDVLQHNARRWRPYFGDITDMWQAGIDLQDWLNAGLMQ